MMFTLLNDLFIMFMWIAFAFMAYAVVRVFIEIMRGR